MGGGGGDRLARKVGLEGEADEADVGTHPVSLSASLLSFESKTVTTEDQSLFFGSKE